MMPHQKAVRLLTAIELMPLEDISEDAEQWRDEIRAAIDTLQAATMPVDDPLRYGIDGELLSEVAFQARLETIVNSMTTWREDRHGRQKNHSQYR
tara:strand:+ start:4483 stop:4767 length:285 start_codon:yes stop_codon:yes gene_type:complete